MVKVRRSQNQGEAKQVPQAQNLRRCAFSDSCKHGAGLPDLESQCLLKFCAQGVSFVTPALALGLECKRYFKITYIKYEVESKYQRYTDNPVCMYTELKGGSD